MCPLLLAHCFARVPGPEACNAEKKRSYRGLLVYTCLIGAMAVAYAGGNVQRQLGLERSAVLRFSLRDAEMQRVIVGSVMMGVAVWIMVLVLGYPLGIAGIFREAMSPCTSDRSIRVAFVLGGLALPLLFRWYEPIYVLDGSTRHPALLALGSAMVSVGCFLSNGCTSGHGLSGMGRLSTRSIVFVATFMGTAFLVTAMIGLE